jgi:hypothetical protein
VHVGIAGVGDQEPAAVAAESDSMWIEDAAKSGYRIDLAACNRV